MDGQPVDWRGRGRRRHYGWVVIRPWKVMLSQHTFQHHDLKNFYKVATQCVIDDVQSYTLINSKVCQIGPSAMVDPSLLTIMFWEMKTIGRTPKNLNHCLAHIFDHPCNYKGVTHLGLRRASMTPWARNADRALMNGNFGAYKVSELRSNMDGLNMNPVPLVQMQNVLCLELGVSKSQLYDVAEAQVTCFSTCCHGRFIMWRNYQSAVVEFRIFNRNQNPNIRLPNYSKTHSPRKIKLSLPKSPEKSKY